MKKLYESSNKQKSVFGIILFNYYYKTLLLLFLILSFFSTNAQYPAGFSQVLVSNNIINPTVMAFTPDGRILVAQQNGILKVVKNNVLLAIPFISLSVNSNGERGLIGIAIDPNFVINQYIYLYYTIANGTNNRISRFTANGDVALANSEVVLLNLDPLSGATNHNGGTMAFGSDGKLYVGIGENANTSHSQNLDTYHGKVLRLNSDGTIPTGNPYTSGTIQRRSVWSSGLRNPYTLGFQPGTGKLFVNDVGQSAWEEINDATAPGLNFGWPSTEGATANPAFASPVFSYSHGSGLNKGCAITGGTFFNPTTTNYPSQYLGRYFYIDFCNSWIDQLNLNGNPVVRSNFAAGIAGSPVGITTGTDGNLYFLSRNNSSLFKVVYTTSLAPSISAQPQSISVSQGSSASFSVLASGSAPLSYQWRKNTVNINGANAATFTINNTTTADAGNYTVLVTNSSGNILSNVASLSVTGSNTAPQASIFLPSTGSLYAGNDVIIFEGSGSDLEDGTLSPANYNWEVKFFHDQHNHPGPSLNQGVSSGTFTIPNSGETATNVFYRIYLKVTDNQGATNTDSVDIQPRLSNINLTTNPAGLNILFDGQPFNTPYSTSSVEGVLRTIGVNNPQVINNALSYNFTGWSHGGTQNQTFATPVNDVNYVANFTTELRNPENPVSTINGLEYSYYNGSFNALPDFTTLATAKIGFVNSFDLSPRTQNDNFAFVYKGFINIPSDGIYTFYTSSDDGSKLFIGNSLVVDNDGLHSLVERTGKIGLKAGKHAITVQFFEQTGGENLIVQYNSDVIAKQVIPNSELFRAVTIVSSTINILPTADAQVRSGSYKNINYGSRTFMEIRNSDTIGSLTREVYLKFPISGFANNVSSAILKLYGGMKLSNVSVNVDIRKSNNTTWQESTLKFTNRPVANSLIVASSSIVGKIPKTYNFDLTSMVLAAKNAGETEITLVLRAATTTSSDFVSFNTKENSLNKPLLVVVNGSGLLVPLNPNLALSKFENENQKTGKTAIYPNPARDGFYIQGINSIESIFVDIFDMSGRRVISAKLEAGFDYLNIENINSGSYIVKIMNGTKNYFHKLLVVKE